MSGENEDVNKRGEKPKGYQNCRKRKHDEDNCAMTVQKVSFLLSETKKSFALVQVDEDDPDGNVGVEFQKAWSTSVFHRHDILEMQACSGTVTDWNPRSPAISDSEEVGLELVGKHCLKPLVEPRHDQELTSYNVPWNLLMGLLFPSAATTVLKTLTAQPRVRFTKLGTLKKWLELDADRTAWFFSTQFKTVVLSEDVPEDCLEWVTRMFGRYGVNIYPPLQMILMSRDDVQRKQFGDLLVPHVSCDVKQFENWREMTDAVLEASNQNGNGFTHLLGGPNKGHLQCNLQDFSGIKRCLRLDVNNIVVSDEKGNEVERPEDVDVRNAVDITVKPCISPKIMKRFKILCHLHQKNSFSMMCKVLEHNCGMSATVEPWLGMKEPPSMRKLPKQVVERLDKNIDWSSYVDLMFVLEGYRHPTDENVYLDNVGVLPLRSSGLTCTHDREKEIKCMAIALARHLAKHSRKRFA